jgi:hypothetical protein
MKTYGVYGNKSIALTLLLSALDGVSGEFRSPAALSPREGDPSTHCIECWVWTLWNKENSFALARNRTTAVQPVAFHYTDWAIQASEMYS